MEIKRGEIWSVLWVGLANKPRPALVIQSEEFRTTDTDILALITSQENSSEYLRIPVKADSENGLLNDSFICLDKLMAIPISKLGEKFGTVSAEVMRKVDEHLIKILGLEKA
jgi:mRNA interferase MazF